jgi:hypothetical protein
VHTETRKGVDRFGGDLCRCVHNIQLCWCEMYSYEIRSWLLQGMRDAIVSGSCLVWILSTVCVCTTCPENIGRVSWFSIIEF